MCIKRGFRSCMWFKCVSVRKGVKCSRKLLWSGIAVPHRKCSKPLLVALAFFVGFLQSAKSVQQLWKSCWTVVYTCFAQIHASACWRAAFYECVAKRPYCCLQHVTLVVIFVPTWNVGTKMKEKCAFSQCFCEKAWFFRENLWKFAQRARGLARKCLAICR